MAFIINPGSGHVASEGEGWQNTEAGAIINAHRWYDRIKEDGIEDIILLPACEYDNEGRWTFWFEHRLTCVKVELSTHGIIAEQLSAYRAEHIFYPRIYWDGSSSSNPEPENWLKDGYRVAHRIEAIPAQAPDHKETKCPQ